MHLNISNSAFKETFLHQIQNDFNAVNNNNRLTLTNQINQVYGDTKNSSVIYAIDNQNNTVENNSVTEAVNQLSKMSVRKKITELNQNIHTAQNTILMVGDKQKETQKVIQNNIDDVSSSGKFSLREKNSFNRGLSERIKLSSTFTDDISNEAVTGAGNTYDYKINNESLSSEILNRTLVSQDNVEQRSTLINRENRIKNNIDEEVVNQERTDNIETVKKTFAKYTKDLFNLVKNKKVRSNEYQNTTTDINELTENNIIKNVNKSINNELTQLIENVQNKTLASRSTLRNINLKTSEEENIVNRSETDKGRLVNRTEKNIKSEFTQLIENVKNQTVASLNKVTINKHILTNLKDTVQRNISIINDIENITEENQEVRSRLINRAEKNINSELTNLKEITRKNISIINDVENITDENQEVRSRLVNRAEKSINSELTQLIENVKNQTVASLNKVTVNRHEITNLKDVAHKNISVINDIENIIDENEENRVKLINRTEKNINNELTELIDGIQSKTNSSLKKITGLKNIYNKNTSYIVDSIDKNVSNVKQILNKLKGNHETSETEETTRNIFRSQRVDLVNRQSTLSNTQDESVVQNEKTVNILESINKKINDNVYDLKNILETNSVKKLNPKLQKTLSKITDYSNIYRKYNLLSSDNIQQEETVVNDNVTKLSYLQNENITEKNLVDTILNQTRVGKSKSKIFNLVDNNIEEKENVTTRRHLNVLQNNTLSNIEERIKNDILTIKDSVVSDVSDIEYSSNEAGSNRVYVEDSYKTAQGELIHQDGVVNSARKSPSFASNNMVYREPVIPRTPEPPPKQEEEDPVLTDDSVLKSQLIDSKQAFVRPEEMDKKEALTEEQINEIVEKKTKAMITEYMSGINLDQIYRSVMFKVEDSIRLERRRYGV